MFKAAVQWDAFCVEVLCLPKASLLSCHTLAFKKENMYFQWNGIETVFSFMCICPPEMKMHFAGIFFISSSVLSSLWIVFCGDVVTALALCSSVACEFVSLFPACFPLRRIAAELRIRIGLPWVPLVVTSPAWPWESIISSCHILNGRGPDPLSRMAERVNTLMTVLHFFEKPVHNALRFDSWDKCDD